MHHDAMAAAEGVVDVLHGEVEFFDFVGSERLGLFETVTEFSAEGFAANQLLIAAHGEGWGWNVFSGLVAVFGASVLIAVGIIRRIDVDQLDVPV